MNQIPQTKKQAKVTLIFIGASKGKIIIKNFSNLLGE
jgi:hypothetical protein